MPIKIPENCIDCAAHRVVSDPDIYDSFCSDDEAVVCGFTANINNAKTYGGKLLEYRPVTVSCRPSRLRKECNRPNWCPLVEK